jgi:aminoglycoside phosphotransferase (APT) family kinase protein
MEMLEEAVSPLLGEDIELAEHNVQGLTTLVHTCDTPTGSYIVRRGQNMAAFRNDAFAAEYAADVDLPIPRVRGIISLADDSIVCISDRAAGSVASDEDMYRQGSELNLSVERALRTLHSREIPAEVQAHAFGIVKRRPATKLYDKTDPDYERRIDIASLEQIARVQAHLERLCMPQMARLCHNDIKGENVIAQGGDVTGVIDWAMAELGDPASDLGRLYVDRPDAFDYDNYGAAIGSEENFKRRVLYYAMATCVGSVRFFSGLQNTAQMGISENRLIELVNEAESV